MLAAFASSFVLDDILGVWDQNSFPAYSTLCSRLPLMAEFHFLWVICFYGVDGVALVKYQHFLCCGNTVEMGSTLQTVRVFLQYKI